MRSSRNILTYLENATIRNPEAIAVIDEFNEYSYKQLFEDSICAGSGLAALDIAGRGVVVLLEKSEMSLAIMLGTLQAGAFYVPVDPNTPLTRLGQIIDALGDPLLVADAETLHKTEEAFRTHTCTSPESLLQTAPNHNAVQNARSSALETDPAYVMFTSGSTGTPKGVVVSHSAILSFIDEFVSTFEFSSNDRFGNQAPFDFDVSVKDIYGSLAVGATLVLVPRRFFMQPKALVDYLEVQRVTVMVWAVAALCLLSTYHAVTAGHLTSVRMILFSGEVMPMTHLKRWLDALPQTRFINLYGPTEITCNCLFHEIDRNHTYEQGIPLGESFGHCQVLLIDEAQHPISEPGRKGELVVRGPSVSLGYIGNVKGTEHSFSQNPLHSNYVDRVYRTGDRAIMLEGGEYVFCGRIDNQIKHLGHRIELEEIDSAFESISGVDRCRCAYESKRQRLYAFFEGEASEQELPCQVREILPTFMLPSKITKVTHMPLNKNGKVDRTHLITEHATENINHKMVHTYE